jgi:two-component system, NtrC family, sensor histidine kinase GlrK
MQDLVSDLRLRDGIDLQTLVQASVSKHKVAAGSKQLAIECDLRPVPLRGDDRKLQTVLDNLLSNAIKYTPAGGRINISLKIVDDRAVIDVEDSGPGIDESEAAKIFEPFQQGRATYQSSVKGTGLGLSIAKEYVEAHDGCIKTVNSTQGAHFRVELPLAGPARTNAR